VKTTRFPQYAVAEDKLATLNLNTLETPARKQARKHGEGCLSATEEQQKSEKRERAVRGRGLPERD